MRWLMRWLRAGLLVAVGMGLLAVLVVAAGCAATGTSRASTTPPRATATPATLEGRLAARVCRAVGSAATRCETTYDATRQKLQVVVTISGDVPITDAEIDAAHTRTEKVSYQAQRAMWTSGVRLNEVMVTINGSTFDDYADANIDWYGVSVVEAATAARLAWDRLTAEAAWAAFDRTALRPRYQPNWHYGEPIRVATTTPS